MRICKNNLKIGSIMAAVCKFLGGKKSFWVLGSILGSIFGFNTGFNIGVHNEFNNEPKFGFQNWVQYLGSILGSILWLTVVRMNLGLTIFHFLILTVSMMRLETNKIWVKLVSMVLLHVRAVS